MLYLSFQGELAQGTKSFMTEVGHKDCAAPGRYLARAFSGHVVCPGCDRTCAIPAYDKVHPGDPFIVRKRNARGRK